MGWVIAWSRFVFICMASIIGYVYEEYRFRKLHPWLYAHPKLQPYDRLKHYRTELLELIKKASQTYLTGYFILQIQQPLGFNLLGNVSCVRLGFTQSIGTALISLPSIWLAKNFTSLAQMVADQNIAEPRKLLRSRWHQVKTFSSAADVVAWVSTEILRQFPRFAERLMDKNVVVVLILAMAV